MFAWAGNAEQVAIMKSLGYRPVALETDNIHSSFATGMIQCAPLAPVFAMGVQIPTVATYVLDVNWCPIVGAGIIRSDVWDRIPPDTQAKLQVLCDQAGAELRAEGRRFHDEALVTLRKGPKTHVHTPTPEESAQWEAFGVELGPKIRGRIVPDQIYDRVQQLLQESRALKMAGK